MFREATRIDATGRKLAALRKQEMTRKMADVAETKPEGIPAVLYSTMQVLEVKHKV